MTAPYYGKRNPGGLTAASPGDTLHFQFGSYNDSGDSESQAGFAVTDVEVFKNGLPTARATDSGYSLISDTGQMGDRAGLNRFSVQVFNTSDDTGFYDAGSWYQVAVDAVTIDGKTVRFWAGSFELGSPSVDVRRIVGDTGAARRFFRFLEKLDTGGDLAVSASVDTGLVNNAVWNGLRADHVGAGSFGQFVPANLVAVLGDTGAAHLFSGRLGTNVISVGSAAISSLSFGANAINASALATDAANEIATAVWGADRANFTTDTGSFGEHLGSPLSATVDTGQMNRAVWQADASRTLTAFQFDTGVWGSNFAGGRTLTAFAFDTGIWASTSRTLTAISDTGLNERLDAIEAKTVNLPGDPADASDIAASFTTVNTKLDTIDDFLDTEIAAIKAKTDSLTFTVAGVVDSNIQRVNDVAIQGTGDTGTGDTWRPA